MLNLTELVNMHIFHPKIKTESKKCFPFHFFSGLKTIKCLNYVHIVFIKNTRSTLRTVKKS